MSHIVTIQTEVRDAEALGLACRRLELGAPILEIVPLFSGEATGYTVRLPDWRYPISLFSIMETLMHGMHVFEPRTRTVIDLEAFIPEDHLLRQVDRIIEPAFIRKLTTSCYADQQRSPPLRLETEYISI